MNADGGVEGRAAVFGERHLVAVESLPGRADQRASVGRVAGEALRLCDLFTGCGIAFAIVANDFPSRPSQVVAAVDAIGDLLSSRALRVADRTGMTLPAHASAVG